ncbi:Uncharacterised protein [Vibrio cholerae]|nr:Uncharacterised protein [Vibrio cholerae]
MKMDPATGQNRALFEHGHGSHHHGDSGANSTAYL